MLLCMFAHVRKAWSPDSRPTWTFWFKVIRSTAASTEGFLFRPIVFKPVSAPARIPGHSRETQRCSRQVALHPAILKTGCVSHFVIKEASYPPLPVSPETNPSAGRPSNLSNHGMQKPLPVFPHLTANPTLPRSINNWWRVVASLHCRLFLPAPIIPWSFITGDRIPAWPQTDMASSNRFVVNPCRW